MKKLLCLFGAFLTALASIPASVFAASDSYSPELQDAYQFAFQNSITTMDSIDKANMNGWLTRIAMAKMLANYAMNILGKKPANTIVPKFLDVSEKLDDDYNWAVTLAYQLGIMWLGIDKFRPNDWVTRAEFATALSRMLYETADGNPYYTTHLAKLKSEWIISNDNPNLQEKRWYVMLMLMRSNKSNNNENNSESTNSETAQNADENLEVSIVNLKIWNEVLAVKLENNSTTRALIEKLKQWDIVVNAHEYWNFEKVWDLGFSLPTEDSQITTQAWDLVLYQWNQVSLFYNSNSRSYTKLWKIQNKSESELKQILWNWDITLTFSLWNFEAEEENKSLVLYFSPTWNTKRIATFISEITSGDITEIIPEIPYTSEDLNYSNNETRATKEQNDSSARPEIASKISLDGYNTIYIGYPIWWGTNPKIILTLIEKYDFSSKEVVLFCTSWSSEIWTSENELKSHGLNIIWSKRFSASSSKDEVQNWIESL